MKIEHVETAGWKAALRGMRNPMNSWGKSDTLWLDSEYPPVLGAKDLKLALKLIKGGSEHRKFLRQIQVWWDITIPRYVWQELDTYKVATVRNSCSTMHTLGVRDLTQDDFESPIPLAWLNYLNDLGHQFRKAKTTKDSAWTNNIRREYKNLLPEGFLQKATYSFNYETALTMFRQRHNHRLSEWRADSPGSICAVIAGLPYMAQFIEAASQKKDT